MREHRHARAVAIEEAVDEVQIARAAAAGADGELARQMRLGARRERGDLLVPDMNPLDLALPAKRRRSARSGCRRRCRKSA